MNTDSRQLTYEHFKSTDWLKAVDSVTIKYDELFAANLRQ